MFRTLIDVPLWAILLEVGIPIAVILVAGALVTLRGDRSDRSNDNLATSAARLSGAYLVFLGTFLAVGICRTSPNGRLRASSSSSTHSRYSMAVRS